MKTRNITHVISTDLKRNVFDIARELTTKNVDVIDVLVPTNVIFANIPKTFDAKLLKKVEGIKAISPNYPISAI